jgi:hypothetical protein
MAIENGAQNPVFLSSAAHNLLRKKTEDDPYSQLVSKLCP